MFTRAAHRIARVLRALIMMNWKPVPFFGVALVTMLLYWVALAILR